MKEILETFESWNDCCKIVNFSNKQPRLTVLLMLSRMASNSTKSIEWLLIMSVNVAPNIRQILLPNLNFPNKFHKTFQFTQFRAYVEQESTTMNKYSNCCTKILVSNLIDVL
jgi:uncharacterized protein YchJ